MSLSSGVWVFFFTESSRSDLNTHFSSVKLLLPQISIKLKLKWFISSGLLQHFLSWICIKLYIHSITIIENNSSCISSIYFSIIKFTDVTNQPFDLEIMSWKLISYSRLCFKLGGICLHWIYNLFFNHTKENWVFLMPPWRIDNIIHIFKYCCNFW